MDERGSGIRRMREAMARQGLDAPRFSVTDNEFTVTLSVPKEAVAGAGGETVSKASAIMKREDLSDRQRQIIARIEEKGFVTSSDCVRSLGIVKNTAWHDLNALLDKGLIEKSGVSVSTRYTLKSNANRTESNANRTQPDGMK